MRAASVRGELTGAAACLVSWHLYIAICPISQRQTRPQGRRDIPVGVGSVHFLSSSLSLAHYLSQRLHRRLGELKSSCRHISGRATPPRASPASLRHRRHVSCSSQASVSPHCLLCCELTSSEFHRDHRRRGQNSLVHHFLSFLSC